jgi:5,10-methenyltetrahydrofolate synthetase
MNAEKQLLRERLKRIRLEMTDAERTLKGQAIVSRLKEAVDWSEVKNLHYFEPLARLMEPDINKLITYLEDTYPDMKMFTPRKIGKEWDLVAVRGGEAPDKFDVILVPALGFDGGLNRIGYGGGYYDRFLITQPQAKKIGICYESGKNGRVPVEDHDVSLSVIITEGSIYKTPEP